MSRCKDGAYSDSGSQNLTYFSSHQNPEVKQFIQQRNELLYSVPYQHYTNAIENFFSVLKSYIQKDEIVGRAALLRSVQTSIGKITPRQYRNFFRGAYERTGSEKYDRGVCTRHRSPKTICDHLFGRGRRLRFSKV